MTTLKGNLAENEARIRALELQLSLSKDESKELSERILELDNDGKVLNQRIVDSDARNKNTQDALDKTQRELDELEVTFDEIGWDRAQLNVALQTEKSLRIGEKALAAEEKNRL